MNKIIAKAFFMIMLMLTLPVLFSLNIHMALAVEGTPYAGTIRSVAIYGDAGLHQLLDEDDAGINVEIVVAADIQQEDILFQSEPMQQCDPHPEGLKCTAYFTKPLAEDYIVADITYGTITIGVPYVIDGSAPRFTSFVVTKSVTHGKLLANFEVTDEVGDTGACAGVAGIEIATDPDFATIVADQNYAPVDIEDCVLIDSIELPQPTTSGDYTYYARSYDKLLHLQLGQTMSSLYVDVDKPIIDEPVLLYNGMETTHTITGTHDFELKAIVDENYGLYEVLADLTDFDGSTDVNATCTKVSGVFDCRWDVRPTIDDTTSSFSGSIEAVDLEGNRETRSFTINVQPDTEAPTIGGIITDHNDMLGGAFNEVTVQISDAGVGYVEEDVKADFTKVNPSLDSRLEADECVNGTCYWDDVIATQEGSKIVTIFATDLYGQSNSRSETVLVDTTKPVITSIAQSTAYPTASDPTPLVLSLNATDDNGIETAYVDISAISTETEPVEGVCDQGLCVFAVADLITSSTLGTVSFVAVDVAGNPSVITDYNIQVFETDIDTIPDEIGIVVGNPSPQKLDRKIASITPTKVFLPITFQHQPLVSVMAKTAVCEGLAPVLVQLGGDNPYFIGAELDDSYLVFDLMLDDVTNKLDRIDLNCSLSLLVARGTTVYANPEIENFTASVELYNIPVGELGTNVMDKLEDIEDSVDTNWWDWIEKLEQLFEGLRKICEMINVVKDVYSAVEAVKPIVYASALVLEEVSGTGEALWKTFLTLECYVRVGKETLWPNDTQYHYTESGYKKAGGTGEFTIIDSITGGKSLSEEDMEIGGFIRRVCAFVMCNQCNRGFGITGVEKISTMFDDMIDEATSDYHEGTSDYSQKLPSESEEDYRKRIHERGTGSEQRPEGPEFEEPEEKEEKESEGLFGLGFLGLAVADIEDVTGAAPAGEEDPDAKLKEQEVPDSGEGRIDLNPLKGIGETLETHMNPRDNWLVALNCLCIPGIIHNAHKYRQLQCIHARCISDSAKAGFSTAPCDIEHKVKECVFWYGALFEFIPGWLLAERVAQVSRDLIKELPGRLIVAARDQLCWDFDKQVKSSQGDFGKVDEFEKCASASENVKLLSDKPLWHIACGLIDLGMLIWSWDNFVENYFDFDDMNFDFKQDDQCKHAFNDLHEAQAAAAEAGLTETPDTPTSVPAGAGNTSGAGFTGGTGGAGYS